MCTIMSKRCKFCGGRSYCGVGVCANCVCDTSVIEVCKAQLLKPNVSVNTVRGLQYNINMRVGYICNRTPRFRRDKCLSELRKIIVDEV